MLDIRCQAPVNTSAFDISNIFRVHNCRLNRGVSNWVYSLRSLRLCVKSLFRFINILLTQRRQAAKIRKDFFCLSQHLL
jgi:hypothetical protein